MATGLVKRAMTSLSAANCIRPSTSTSIPKVAPGTDILSTPHNVSLQKARTWDEGVASNFSTTPLKDIFKGAFTGVCSEEHVPTYMDNIDKFNAKGIDVVICVAINDPYTMNEWAEKLQGKDVDLDLLLKVGPVRTTWLYTKWSAYVVDGKIKALNVEEDPSVVTVSAAQTILEQI
ncbi:hypothetical protein RJT34_14179 [Clitoria ternatea]|uniref:glutaredoxin-dependent peroxiredoxin n=1 Tax=Clitoria ternatea TaxID=43366 RepID=A0AAN9PM63_CLITE